MKAALNEEDQKILKLFKPPTKEEIENDLKDAKKNKKSQIINKLQSIINKNGGNLDEIETRKKYDQEIYKILSCQKKDFKSFMKIYSIYFDPNKSGVLKSHFVFKEKIINDLPNIEFNLGYTYDDNKYYHNFISGMLSSLKIYFENRYLTQYISSEYFTSKNKAKAYKERNGELNQSLENMLKDIERLLEFDGRKRESKYTQTQEPYEGEKIPENEFDQMIIRAKLKENKKELNKLYLKCKTTNDIIKALQKEEKYIDLFFYVNDYLKLKQINEENMTMKDSMKEMKDSMKEMKDSYDKINKENMTMKDSMKEMKDSYDKINKENMTMKDSHDKMNEENENLKNSIKEMNKKITFMEKIMMSSLSRKVINHCMNELVNKYRECIQIVYSNDDSFEIICIKSINEKEVKEINALIKALYDKKKIYNKVVHFEDIDEPDFIGDSWNAAINFMELSDSNLNVFKAIFTDDIKNSFRFSNKDNAVSKLLKK